MFQYLIPFCFWGIFHCLFKPQFVYSLIFDRYLGCWQFLISQVLLEIHVQILLLEICFHFIKKNIWSWKYMVMNMLYFTIFFQFFLQWLCYFTFTLETMTVPLIQNSCQHLNMSAVFILVILGGEKWYLSLVLVCIPLMTNDVQHNFMYLAICIAFAVCLLKFLALFKIWLLNFAITDLLSQLYPHWLFVYKICPLLVEGWNLQLWYEFIWFSCNSISFCFT